MTRMILTRGVPASGKTTYALAWAAEAEGRIRANRDSIREMLGYPALGSGAEESVVTKVEQGIVRDALKRGDEVIVDDTNLNPRFVKQWVRLAGELGAYVDFLDFEISQEDAIENDLRRGNGGGRRVGSAVITNFFNRHKIDPKTGFLPPIPRFDAPKPFEKYVPVEGTPHAIIVDIDGTLANHEGVRSPYDASKYHLDSLNEDVWRVADRYTYGSGTSVIILSGRDAAYQVVTQEWLHDNGVWYDFIYMRPEGDKRNDAIVKDELFERYIAPFFTVDFVLDDRDRVVRMWRQKGIRALQVQDGDF